MASSGTNVPLTAAVSRATRRVDDALYPPDNPGTFLVATRGSIRPDGAIVVSMVVLDETEPSDQVQVTLKRIVFREQ